MIATCPECGAAVPAGGTCRGSFHTLLLLESEIPGGPGAVPHFYAVARRRQTPRKFQRYAEKDGRSHRDSRLPGEVNRRLVNALDAPVDVRLLDIRPNNRIDTVLG